VRKIPSLFVREFDGDPRYVTRVVNPVCQWVIDGEGIATEKHDGTACMVRSGVLFARFDRKRGKPAPDGWEPCEEAPDTNTGHWPGWIQAIGPEHKWHRAVMAIAGSLPDGTYELVGPRVGGNPHGLEHHELWRHGCTVVGAPRDFDGLRLYLATIPREGIVWHHPDGRMAKIKTRDFGLDWPRKEVSPTT